MTVMAWHFIEKRGVLRHGTPAADPAGIERYSGEPDVGLCGLHASTSAVEAVWMCDSRRILRRVECGGRMDTRGTLVSCTERNVLWTVDATDALADFHIYVWDESLNRAEENGIAVDPACRKYLDTRRAWLRGEISRAEHWAAFMAQGGSYLDLVDRGVFLDWFVFADELERRLLGLASIAAIAASVAAALEVKQ